MQRMTRILWLTAIESFATILIERGVYFYTHGKLGFTDAENLMLALGFGAAYVVGALASHGASERLRERRMLLMVIGGQVLAHMVLCLRPTSAVVVVGTMVIGLLNGLKWPVIESYIGAGRTPSETVRSVGRFNLSWSAAVPLALVVAGPVIGWWAPGLFGLAAVLNVGGLALAAGLARQPVHLPLDHPERATPVERRRFGALLVSSRWSMVASYSLMWVLAALMPEIFDRLGFAVVTATAMSGLLDVIRFASFAALQTWRGWHNRAWPLALVIVGMPLGFFMVLFGPDIAWVLAGELIFGASAGMTYYAALYYAMVVKDASVVAGGGHEGIIGAGFAIGPAAGLLGRALEPMVGSLMLGRIIGLGTLVVVCAAGAIRALGRARRGG